MERLHSLAVWGGFPNRSLSRWLTMAPASNSSELAWKERKAVATTTLDSSTLRFRAGFPSRHDKHSMKNRRNGKAGEGRDEPLL